MGQLLKFSVRVGVFGGVLYYTKKIGVWDDSVKTNALLKDTVTLIKPYIYSMEHQLPVQIKNLPSKDDIFVSVTGCWNHGVISTISFIRRIPSCSVEYSKIGISYVRNKFEQGHTNPKPLVHKENS